MTLELLLVAGVLLLIAFAGYVERDARGAGEVVLGFVVSFALIFVVLRGGWALVEKRARGGDWWWWFLHPALCLVGVLVYKLIRLVF